MVDKDSSKDNAIGRYSHRITFRTRQQCRYEMLYRMSLTILGIVTITLYLYIAARALELLGSDETAQAFVLPIMAVAIIISWPLILLASLTVSAAILARDALHVYNSDDFPANPWPSADDTNRRDNYIAARTHTHTVAASHSLNTLLDYQSPEDILHIEPLFGTKIGKYESTWYHLTSAKHRRTYMMLRVSSMRLAIPMTVINSSVESGGLLPYRYKNGTTISISPEIDRKLSITTVHGAQREIRTLLNAAMLRKLISIAGNCDIEINREFIDFVWHEDILTDNVLDGRRQAAAYFIESLLARHQGASTYVNDVLIPRLSTEKDTQKTKYVNFAYAAGAVALIALTSLAVILSGSDLSVAVFVIISIATLLIALFLTALALLGALRSVFATNRHLVAMRNMRHHVMYHEKSST